MEEETLTKIPINARIKNIDFVDFRLNESTKGKRQKLDFDKFVYEFAFNIRVNPPQQEIIINTIVKIFSDDTRELKLGEIESSGNFQVLNWNDIITDHNIRIPILALFAGVLISTTRGFFILKSKGTFLEGAIIPIIDPTKIMTPQKVEK